MPTKAKINFTERFVSTIKAPTKGEKWYYDHKIYGLCIRARAGGSIVYALRWRDQHTGRRCPLIRRSVSPHMMALARDVFPEPFCPSRHQLWRSTSNEKEGPSYRFSPPKPSVSIAAKRKPDTPAMAPTATRSSLGSRSSSSQVAISPGKRASSPLLTAS